MGVVQMKGKSKMPEQERPDSTSQERTENDSIASNPRPNRHGLVVRGVTVIDRGRRGAPHKLSVRGRTVIDRRIED